MKNRASWTQRFWQGMQQQEGTLPMQPILELCGDRRVWIENHRGVMGYSTEEIAIAVRFGQFVVRGHELQLRKMEGNILLIVGKIETITIRKV